MLSHEFSEAVRDPWTLFGFAAQAVFMMRFVVQWWASEKRGTPVIPVAFWYFSVAGALCLSAYGFHRRDPVILLGQSLPLTIYLRNLYLLRRKKPSDLNR